MPKNEKPEVAGLRVAKKIVAQLLADPGIKGTKDPVLKSRRDTLKDVATELSNEVAKLKEAAL